MNPSVLKHHSQNQRSRSILLHPACKPLLFAVCLVPIAMLVYGVFANSLGANPAEKLIRSTGDWTLRFLCLTLSITPLRRWFSQPALMRFRRMLGVYTYYYACMHFLCYGWLDMNFVLTDIVRDIAKRPFILVGSLALLFMTPLALTSFNRAIKTIGATHWKTLHRTIYLIAFLGLLHFLWMRSAKRDYTEAAIYVFIVAILMGSRLIEVYRAYRNRIFNR